MMINKYRDGNNGMATDNDIERNEK